MFYLLAFSVGYFLGSNKPSIQTNPDGSLTILPQSNPSTQPTTQNTQRVPLGSTGYSVDVSGNIYDSSGKLVAAAGTTLASIIRTGAAGGATTTAQSPAQ